MSQERLAALSSIPRPNLSDIEKGKRDVMLSTIQALANALNVSPGTLVDAERPRPEGWEEDLTRGAMERIAGSVVKHTCPKDPAERYISDLLKEALRCSLQSVHFRGRRLPLPGRMSGRAWLILRAMYPAETLNSLVARTFEHADRLWTSGR